MRDADGGHATKSLASAAGADEGSDTPLMPLKSGALTIETMLELACGLFPEDGHRPTGRTRSASMGLSFDTLERMQLLAAHCIEQHIDGVIQKQAAHLDSGPTMLKHTWDETSLYFYARLRVLQRLFPGLNLTEMNDLLERQLEQQKSHKKKSGGRFVLQLFQAECYADFGNGVFGSIPVAAKLVKTTSAADLYTAFRRSVHFLFTCAMKRRLASNTHWHYIAYHADSLSANLLFQTRLAFHDFDSAVVDRVPCLGHQLNLGALESLACLGHTTPIHKVISLLATESAMSELLAACRKLASSATVHRGVQPPEVARVYVEALLQHTFRA